MFVAGLEMQRSASLVLLAFVGEVALNHIERLGHALVKVCRNGRIRLHDDVQHHRPQRVVRVADGQRNVALTLEGETDRSLNAWTRCGTTFVPDAMTHPIHRQADLPLGHQFA